MHAVHPAEQDQCSKASASVKVVRGIYIRPADASARLRGFSADQRTVWQHLVVLQYVWAFLGSLHALATIQLHLSPASSTCAMSDGADNLPGTYLLLAFQSTLCVCHRQLLLMFPHPRF